MGGLSAQPIIIGRFCLGGYVDWAILTNVCVTLHRTLHFSKYDSNTWAFVFRDIQRGAWVSWFGTLIFLPVLFSRFFFSGGVWNELERALGKNLNTSEVPYSPRAVGVAIDVSRDGG